MANASQYYNADLAWLRRHKLELQACLSAIALGQQYQMGDRSITRADYNVMVAAMAAVSQEISRQEAVAAEGTEPAGSVIYPNFGGLAL